MRYMEVCCYHGSCYVGSSLWLQADMSTPLSSGTEYGSKPVSKPCIQTIQHRRALLVLESSNLQDVQVVVAALLVELI
jgi:hypothetical protein